MSVMNTFYGRTFDPMEMTERKCCAGGYCPRVESLMQGAAGISGIFIQSHSIRSTVQKAKARNCRRDAAELSFARCERGFIVRYHPTGKEHLNNYLEIEAKIMSAVWKHFHLENLTEEEQRIWERN